MTLQEQQDVQYKCPFCKGKFESTQELHDHPCQPGRDVGTAAAKEGPASRAEALSRRIQPTERANSAINASTSPVRSIVTA
jgi:hypothetical protein